MNARAEGVFEAVSYVRDFVARNKSKRQFVPMLERELISLIDDVSTGTAVDFRFRLRNMKG